MKTENSNLVFEDSRSKDLTILDLFTVRVVGELFTNYLLIYNLNIYLQSICRVLFLGGETTTTRKYDSESQ